MRVAALLALVAPALAWADPCPQAMPIAESDTAACDGLLIPESMARDALACAEVHLPACRERAAIDAQQAATDMTLCISERDATRAALSTVERAVVPPPAPWYERPAVTWPLGLGVGIVAGAGLTWAVTR